MDTNRSLRCFVVLAIVGFVFFGMALILLFHNIGEEPDQKNDLITRMESLEAKLESWNNLENIATTLQETMTSLNKTISLVEEKLHVTDEMYYNFSSILENQLLNTNAELEKLDRRLTEYEGSVEKHAVACEYSKVILECEGIHKTIKTKYANYGRTQPGSVVCPHRDSQFTNCFGNGTTQKVAHSCDGLHKCELMAINAVFGEPCDTTYKYLKVDYYCV